MAERIPLAALWQSPAHFLALGAGLGLSPKAPGTVGTLLGVIIWFFMPETLWLYLLVLVVLFAVGVWCCQRCAAELGVHDHPGIVWDEVVGYLLVMTMVPQTWLWAVVGFVVFRFFDILKPWPISWVDRQVHGGLGIMLDDVLAGVFGVVVVQLLLLLSGSG